MKWISAKNKSFCVNKEIQYDLEVISICTWKESIFFYVGASMAYVTKYYLSAFIEFLK